MPFTDSTPSSWLGAGYNTQSGKMELNTADALTDALLPELSDAEADEASGDIARLLYGLIDGLYVKAHAKNSELAPADRPTRFRFVRNTSVNEASGFITRDYSLSFTLGSTGLSGLKVAAEP